MGVAVVKKQSLDAEVKRRIDAAMVHHLFKQVDQFNEKIGGLATQRDELIKQIADLTCPFKPGQTLKTTKGNGVNGIRVNEYVVPPTNPGSGFTKDNRWAIHCTFFSKTGEVTNRFVVITEERHRDGMFGEITVKK